MIIKKNQNDNYTFKLYNSNLENTKCYNYSDIMITTKGNCKQATEELSKKGMRNYYSLIKEFNFSCNTSPKTLIKLFHSSIQPILVYRSDLETFRLEVKQL